MHTVAKSLTVTSPGKLNLIFDILGDLPNGYHEVETLMQAVDIYDELTFSCEPAEKLSVKIAEIEFATVISDVPKDQSNLIVKAAHLFFSKLDENPKLKIQVHLKKAVPVAGGMGGGSGNAAATLVALNKLFDCPFSEAQIFELCAQLGADVPFFVNGGTQIGTHRGDVLNPVECAPDLNLLIVGPSTFGLSTPEVYKAYDSGDRNRIQVNLDRCVENLKTGNVSDAAKDFGNCFESVVFAKRPELKFLFERLQNLGGICARLTGSGPTLYVVTESAAQSETFQSQLLTEQASGANGWNKHPELKIHTWVCKAAPNGLSLN